MKKEKEIIDRLERIEKSVDEIETWTHVNHMNMCFQRNFMEALSKIIKQSYLLDKEDNE